MPLPKVERGAVKYIILCGVMSAVYQRLNISLSGVIPGVIFFPVSNGSMVVFSVITGRIFFGERLNKLQIAGVVLALSAIVAVGLG